MNALILGGADCLWDDLAALSALLGQPTARDDARNGIAWAGLVLAVNEAAIHYGGRIDHWVSLHPNQFPRWRGMRVQSWIGEPPVMWCHEHYHATTIAQRMTPLLAGGSSGLFAAYEVATLALGCSKVVLCGVPMDARPHFHKPGKWIAVSGFKAAWTTLAQEGKMSHVRSMSGYTRELLGSPDVDWLNGRMAA